MAWISHFGLQLCRLQCRTLSWLSVFTGTIPVILGGWIERKLASGLDRKCFIHGSGTVDRF